jgi:hypothetical protein
MLYPTELRARHRHLIANADGRVVWQGEASVVVWTGMDHAVVAMPIVNFDFSFHQHASPAIRENPVADGRPLASARVLQPPFQLGHVGCLNEPVLVSLR